MNYPGWCLGRLFIMGPLLVFNYGSFGTEKIAGELSVLGGIVAGGKWRNMLKIFRTQIALISAIPGPEPAQP
jgi:hypothetical protein